MLNSISSRPTNGKLEGKETPRVTINFGEVSRARLCDLNSTRSQHYLHLEFAFQFFKTFKFCFRFFLNGHHGARALFVVSAFILAYLVIKKVSITQLYIW
jgi:hypothetical protein